VKIRERNIYKITDYSFDGLTHKPRYIIVLQVYENGVIYATVSKSQILPSKFKINDRKVKDTKGCVWCFKFEKDDVIGSSKNFKFPETCYINVSQRPSIFNVKYEEFESILKNNSVFIDFLDIEIFFNLLLTVYNGLHVIRKIKKAILPKIEGRYGKLS
jgi:hypothetical protein